MKWLAPAGPGGIQSQAVRSLWAFCVVLLAGCFTKPPDLTGDGGTVADAPPDAPFPSCAGVMFPPMSTRLTELTATGEPTITTSGLEIYWMVEVMTAVRYEIHHATRTQIGDAFEQPGIFVPALFEPINQDPSISGDGTLLVYRGIVDSQPRALEMVRMGDTWTSPIPLAGLTDRYVKSLDLAPNGLTLYFTNDSNQLFIATRPDRQAPFVVLGQFGAEFAFPTVSADGLELFFHDGTGISRVERASTAASWQSNTAVRVIAGDFDPDLSPDGATMYTAFGNGISVVNRDCQ